MSTPPVTDQDLMRYVDDELDPARLEQVQAELARSPRARDLVASIQETGEQVRQLADARAVASGADGIVDDVMARIEADARGNVIKLRPGADRAPAELAHRGWGVAYALGGLAAAAAVAMVLWQVVGTGVSPIGSAVPPEPSPSPISSGAEVASARIPAPDYDPEPSVSVDAVDFGARTGTIFYVPADKGTTTIVWLSDDESGGM